MRANEQYHWQRTQETISWLSRLSNKRKIKNKRPRGVKEKVRS